MARSNSPLYRQQALIEPLSLSEKYLSIQALFWTQQHITQSGTDLRGLQHFHQIMYSENPSQQVVKLLNGL